MSREGDEILAAYRAGEPNAVAHVRLRMDDGVTERDIRDWYNQSPKKRTKILDVQVAKAYIYITAKKKWGDEERAIQYTLARVPFLSDASVNDPPPDKSDKDRPLFCCLQPRIDRWLKRMRLMPCTNDELDQRLRAEGHKTINSLIRAEMAAGNL
jgi:hypothetical protein